MKKDIYRILFDTMHEIERLEDSDIFHLLKHENSYSARTKYGYKDNAKTKMVYHPGIAYCKLKSFPLISKERLEHLENCERIAMGVSKEANLEPGQFFTIGKKGEA